MRILPGPTKSNQTLAWSPDGRLVVAGGTGDGVMVWDVAAGTPGRRVLTRGHGGRVLQFCPRTGRLLVGFRSGLWRWHPDTDEEGCFDWSSGVACVAVSPDGRTVALSRYEIRAMRVAGYALSADGTAVREWARSAVGWDYTTTFTFRPGTGDLFSYGWHAGRISRFQQVGAADGELHGSFAPTPASDRVTNWALAPDGQRVAWLTDRSVQVRNLDDSESVARPVSGVSRRVLVWSPDGRTLALAEGGTLRLLDAATLAEVRAFDWGIGGVRAVAFAPDGLRAAVSGDSGRGWVAVFDLE